MENTINDRYKTIIKEVFGGNKSLFAKSIGVTPSVLEYIVGKNTGKPSYSLIEKTLKIEGLSADWLILGRGSMFIRYETQEECKREEVSDLSCIEQYGSSSHSSIMQRIKEYIDSKGITNAAFERSVNMANASFGKLLKTGGSIGVDKLERIIKVYPDISVYWLILGQGEMISSEQATPKDPLEGILVEQQLRSVMKQNEMLLKNVEMLTRLLEQEKKKHESTPSQP